MLSSLKAYYEKLILGHPKTVLTLVVLITLAAAAGLPRFKLDASADSLTLETDNALDYYREVSERYASGDFLVVTYHYKNGDLFSPDSLANLRRLSTELSQVQGATGIQSILNVPLLYSPKIFITDIATGMRTLSMPDTNHQLAREEFLNSPIYRNLILSPDGQTTALVINLKPDSRGLELVRERDALRRLRNKDRLNPEQQAQLQKVSAAYLQHRTESEAQSRARVEQVREIISHYSGDAELFLGGISMITADMIAFIQNDLVVFGAGTLLFIVLTLLIIFRQVRWVLLPLATCVSTAVTMLGLLSWLDWRLTVISANFVALLLIITLAITIHLAVRYREYFTLHPEWDRKQLALATVSFMAKPCLYTGLTTIVAFISLVASGIRPVIDFGWMMSIGVILALMMAFLIIPASLVLLRKRNSTLSKDNSHVFTLLFSRFTERHTALVLSAAALAAVFSVFGISKLKVENRFIDYFDDSTEIYQGMLVIDQQLGGTTPLEIVIDMPTDSVQPLNDRTLQTADTQQDDDAFEEDPFADEDPFGDEETTTENSYWFTTSGLARIEKLHDFLEQQPEIGKVQSLATLYKVARDLKGSALNDFELAVARNSLPPEINQVLVEPYWSTEHNQTRITLRVLETDPGLRRSELIQRIYTFAEDDLGISSENIHLTGMLVLYNNMLQSLFQSQILTLGAVFIGILLMFLVLFRSLWLALIALTPNILAAGIVLGGMGLAGIPLDMMTITIAAITVGIGVDNAIHYIYRYREEFHRDGDYLASMHRSHATIGRAMFYTAITIVAGFSILALSEFVPSIYFGLLTALAMSTALLGSLTLLPLLLLLIKPFPKPAAAINTGSPHKPPTTESCPSP